MEIIWGYVGTGGIGYQYKKSIIVAQNAIGDYYRIETTGHGIGLAGVSLDIVEPGTSNTMYTHDTWGAEIHATLVGLIQADISAMGRFDSSGFSWDSSEYSYLAFSDISLALMVSAFGVIPGLLLMTYGKDKYKLFQRIREEKEKELDKNK